MRDPVDARCGKQVFRGLAGSVEIGIGEKKSVGKRPPHDVAYVIDMFPELPNGTLVTATNPQTVLALICADDFGAAVAAAVADPDKFHETEIDLAGDALTYPEIADTLSRATGREIKLVFVSQEEQAQRIGSPSAYSEHWNDEVGYPARPDHAARYGLTTTSFEKWAAQRDWQHHGHLSSNIWGDPRPRGRV